jgi:hypothetical protein
MEASEKFIKVKQNVVTTRNKYDKTLVNEKCSFEVRTYGSVIPSLQIITVANACQLPIITVGIIALGHYGYGPIFIL